MTYHAPPDTPDTAHPTTDFWATRLGLLLAMEAAVLLILHPIAENVGGELGHHLAEAFLLSSIGAAWLFTPVFIYKDLSATAHTQWPTRRRAYLIGTLLCPLPVGAYYLYRRYCLFGSPPIPFGSMLRPGTTTDPADRTPTQPASNWWAVAALAVLSDVLFVLFIGLLLADAPEIIRHPLLAIITVLSVFRFVILPIALYKDAVAVQRAAVDWDPNPLLLAVSGWFLCLFVCPYYLIRRLPSVPGVSFDDPFARPA